MSALVVVTCTLVVVLALYAAGLYVAAATFVVSRLRARRSRRTAPAPAPAPAVADLAITVLVPARDEGPMAVRAIRSLLRQDTPVAVTVQLLIKDQDDTSWPHLLAAFPAARLAAGAGSVVLLDTASGYAGPRRVTVELCGVEGKADKVDAILPRIATPLTAILDCDHQAHPSWLSSAAARMASAGARVVQGRRHALAAGGIFSLWDSLHQHVGCELFNAAFDHCDLSVFVTGTTFVIDTALLRRHPLRQCLTEDTDLSYSLFMAGERVVADPRGGSDEEVSPDLYSFLARRRRWANGHTDAFLRHLPDLRAAPVRARDRVQFVFHGLHYLMAAAVFALHLVIGAFVALALPAPAVLGSLTLGVGAAAAVARTQRTRGLGARASEVAVLTGWFLPAALMLATAVVAWLGQAPVEFSLPLPAPFLAVGLVALLAPLVVQLVGLVGFGLLTETSLLAVVLTYPVAFFLDLAGVLLGLTDFVAKRGVRQTIARAPRLVTPRGRRAPGAAPTSERLTARGAALRVFMVDRPPELAFAVDGAEAISVSSSVGVRPRAAARTSAAPAPASVEAAGDGLTPVVSIPES